MSYIQAYAHKIERLGTSTVTLVAVAVVELAGSPLESCRPVNIWSWNEVATMRILAGTVKDRICWHSIKDSRQKFRPAGICRERTRRVSRLGRPSALLRTGQLSCSCLRPGELNVDGAVRHLLQSCSSPGAMSVCVSLSLARCRLCLFRPRLDTCSLCLQHKSHSQNPEQI